MDKRTIKIVCFAGLRKYFGAETTVAVAPEATYSDVVTKLATANPEAKEVLKSCRIAVKEEFVPLNEKLKSVDTLFLIPPSSGG
ncbi:MoaD/ThiS family protein [Maribellus maritimus]|uniref:MoaD/ThiS family protein n=1 Tax=Maribellus maritimus TaxID=2870838 RepID=UPI001EEBBCAA|nr:MoaD/ThiS family protein [Maribellus maritimus]MCG6188845.1 MoaD/ThiS family protein [Maribellus maritimus]